MLVLGIESSCDETAAAIVESDGNQTRVLSNVIASQIKEHTPYGGVVPEIAARAHVEKIDIVISQAIEAANKDWTDLDGIAVTSGPGLIGGVIVGLMSAKAISIAHNLPFIGVNHLEGHALSPRLSENVAFPYLLLLVSGGHCQILRVDGVGQYRRLGTTIDDALGECFDKVAKILGLGYPGGPLVEVRAKLGNVKRFAFPRPLYGREGCDFSFAGLKTAVLRTVEQICNDGAKLSETDINDICASFETTIVKIIKDRLKNAFAISGYEGEKRLVIAGGVAANQFIRQNLSDFCAQHNWLFYAPKMEYCGDNGAMIALAGLEKLRLGQVSNLDLAPRPRWPLDSEAAPISLKNGWGKKGAKA